MGIEIDPLETHRPVTLPRVLILQPVLAATRWLTAGPVEALIGLLHHSPPWR